MATRSPTSLDEHKPKLERRSTISPTPQPPPNPLKRKEPSDGPRSTPPTTTSTVTTHQVEQSDLPEEYKNGHVVCQVCGVCVNIRDKESGGFTVKIWEAHRATCCPPATSSRDTVIYTPESTAEALAHPPAKRRRAKRTEDERIEYLRADPYVAQFEAYRVLCASCDKWIRLRPNSTYCSIPWDAHRKSCLAKKINNKNAYALEERNNLFSKDPDVRKFDAERLLCDRCDQWLSVSPDDHLQAVQKWLHHRATCSKSSSSSSVTRQHPKDIPRTSSQSQTQLSLASAPTMHPSSASSPTSPSSPKPSNGHAMQHHQVKHSPSLAPPRSPSFYDLNPNNYPPIHESRRRNAEQRAATLRADHLIGEVEPNRVFCTLCQKWVQLRQDSSFCAYPWLQHRGKCLARHQRRAQKAVEIAEIKARRQGQNHNEDDDDELLSSDESSEPESEEDVDPRRDDMRRKDNRVFQRHREQPRMVVMSSSALVSHKPRSQPHYHSPYTSDRSVPRRPDPYRNGRPSHPDSRPSNSGGYPHHVRRPRPWDEEMDAEGDVDAEGDSYMEEEQPPPAQHNHRRGTPARRPWPVGLADLDSPSGRKQFVFGSIEYLFDTTYESSDDMTISALLTYLNAAMPQDKHEDFDTSEVVRYVAALKEKGRIVFEGDMIRMVN